jgi:DNA polymerase-3 subunit gamma/tau
VGDIRTLKDEASYRAMGGNMRIITMDESHMISTSGQNAMLQILEEGREGLLFLFATTEAEKMLPTIRSRCVQLSLKLLTSAEIYERLRLIVEEEGFQAEEKALRIISTYVRGHMRDALVLLEQLMRMSGSVTEELVRTHLRLDKIVEVYELLTEREKPKMLQRLEHLLCQRSPGDLAEGLGQVLIDTYKMHLGVGNFSQVDTAWMAKVLEVQGVSSLLGRAEKLLSLHTDFASIQYGIAAFMRILEQEAGQAASSPSGRGLMPGSAPAATSPSMHRKPSVTKG